MNATRMLFFVCLVGVPAIVLAQETDPILRRELFDARNRATDPSPPTGVAEPSVGGVKCGTVSREVDAATLAEAAAGAAKFRATGLRGYVQAETVQLDEDDGIEFQLEFANEGSNPIELSDVSNALSIVLFRNTAPLLGHVIPSWTFHRTGPPKYSTEYPDEAEVRAEALAAKKEAERNRPYRVAEPARRAETVRTLRDIRDTGDVRLKPGDRFQMVVRIAEGIADPAKYWWNLAEMSKETGGSSLRLPEPSDLAPLSAGEYSLSLWASVSISTSDPDETAPARQHTSLFSGSILIRLGEEQPEESGEEQSR